MKNTTKVKVIWLVMVLLVIGIVIKIAFPVNPEGNFGLIFAAVLALLVMFMDFIAEDEAEEDNKSMGENI